MHKNSSNTLALSLTHLPSSSLHPSLRPVNITDMSDNLSFLTAHFFPIDSNVVSFSLCSIKSVSRCLEHNAHSESSLLWSKRHISL